MYKIKLPNFEGPFDLLLYFIKKDELNIYDIPIARITEEFLKYIRLMKYFDLELAGEFLVMAATLMYIKTQMLLPNDDNEEDENAEDPRTQLVQRLIEYKQFKEAGRDFSALAEEQRYIYYRRLFNEEYKLAEEQNPNNYSNANLFNLMKAFQTAMERNTAKPKQHLVTMINITVDEKKHEILDSLKKKNNVTFFEITMDIPRIHIVVTFLAVLELIKSRLIYIRQVDLFEDILIAYRPEISLN